MCCQRGTTSKIILELTCLILMMVGILVGAGGFLLLTMYKHYSVFFAQMYVIIPGILALCSAAFLVFTSSLTLKLKRRDSRCLQGLFLYLLIVIFCLQCTTLALTYINYEKLDSDLAGVHEVFQKYTGSSQDRDSRVVDESQEELHCCGVRDYTDWMETSWFGQTGGHLLPRSCCNVAFPSCNGTVNQPWQLYSEGCQTKLEKMFRVNLGFIMWASLPVCLSEVVGLLLVLSMMMKQQGSSTYQQLS